MAKVQTGLRLDPDVHAKLEILAKRESRTLNNLAEYIIKLYLADYEKENGEIRNP